MSPPRVTVCIPAYNEEQSIRKTLESILTAMRVTEDRPLDLLLCANACKDDTVGEIRKWAIDSGLSMKVHNLDAPGTAEACDPEETPQVTVLVTDVPGKPNACNALHRYARGEVLIFADADVTVHPRSFGRLISALEDNRNVVAACAVVLAPSGGGLLNPLYRRMAMKMKEFATKKPPYLNGPLYAIRKGAAGEIPSEIIGEDAYLGMKLGTGNILKVEEALAYQVPPNTFPDYFKRQVRNKLSDLQLRTMFGDDYLKFRADTRDARTRNERLLCLSPAERFIRIATFPQTWLLKILDWLAKNKANRMFESGNIRWYTITSTKK